MQKHYSIPIFIPELACPHQCIFCNQKKISGQMEIPSPDEVITTIEGYLSTIHIEDAHVEIAFFGGNFTGIPVEDQIKYLEIVQPYFEKGISGLRCSTRPDYIDEETVARLKKYGMNTIELGAQSMCENVLVKSGRGHTVDHIVNASKIIKDAGLDLGLQMMVGLPGDTLQDSINTANKIVELGADNTRIYPVIVIKDTRLANLYNKREYIPLSLLEAIKHSTEIYKIFEKADVTILRVGLHPSEGLLNGEDLVAGPFHKSFRELVYTELWSERLRPLIAYYDYNGVKIYVPEEEMNYAIGHQARNRNILKQYYHYVKFVPDPKLTGRDFHVDFY